MLSKGRQRQSDLYGYRVILKKYHKLVGWLNLPSSLTNKLSRSGTPFLNGSGDLLTKNES